MAVILSSRQAIGAVESSGQALPYCHCVSEPAGNDQSDKAVLRGSTLVSAPFTLFGVIAAAIAVYTVIWVFGSGTDPGGSAWVTLAVAGALAFGAFTAARGCRVVLSGGEMRDVVAWKVVFRTRQEAVAAVRVRRGPWRTYEMETDDGKRRVVLGAGPMQFPSNLLPGARDRDLAAIDLMMGEMGS